jgi:regulator of sirC expression with transglutaminase-like and TPR domain
MINYLIVLLVIFAHLSAGDPRLTALLSSLDPLSVSEHLAFYELYPETEEGKKSLAHAWQLLNQGRVKLKNPELILPTFDIQAVVSVVTRQPFDPPVILSEEQLQAIDTISKGLANRKLKGYTLWTKQELLALSPEDVDLGRGLLINQFDEKKDEIRQYEAGLDLMALQILARLPQTASPEDKVREINRFVFQEMRFKFPPHSIYAKDIDLYTFLPSVMDSREGVCLGVSILYLCLAQRIGLPLEIITPPGHIYIRYRDGVNVINVETTARGINLPSETYLGIDTRRLQQRNIKEVIGLAFVNQASVAWGQGDPVTTLDLYHKAAPYLPNDPLLNMFMGFNYLFIGKKSEAKKLLEPLKKYTFDYAVSPETIPEDYLNGRVDAEGIKVVFMHVDETRESILEKQKQLQNVVSRYPRFRAGLLQLAVSWLQMGRANEAREILEKYHAIDPTNCVIEYYLSILCLQRYDYNRSWNYLKQTEALLTEREHKSQALRGVKDALRRVSPTPF